MRALVLLVLLTLAPLVAAQELGSVPKVEPGPDAPVGEVLEWTTPEGQEYWYRLPKKQRGKRKPSLVLMLHGTGLNHGWSFWNYPIASGEFRGDDVVVSPDGLTPGNGDTFNFVQSAKDGDQIVGLIELFRSRFDVGNVYLYGHSQGAFFCYWFAGEHPELVDGIVAHAGNVLDVKHSKLAKEKVAIGILHARSDQVVSVECAERTERIYRDEGYLKLKCWIVEGIGDHAGHWPLPDHVATMFEWLDTVSTSDAGSATEVAATALRRETPDLATAVRAAGEARVLLKKYKADDAAEVAERLALVERALEAVAEKVWATLEPAVTEHGGGKEPGPYAVDVRWARAQLGAHEGFAARSKPLKAAFGKHDKALEKLAKAKAKGDEDKKYAKALVAALEESWLAADWDAVLGAELRRAEAGWAPLDGLAGTLTDLRAANGEAPSTTLLDAVRGTLRDFVEANPALAGE